MTSKKLDNPIIALSVKAYQVFLYAYPTKFQQEYGSQMLQLFQDCSLRAFRQSGAKGISRLWAFTLLDFLRSVFEQHLQKETDLSQSRLIKWSGWAFILGAIAFLSILQGSNTVGIIGSVISAISLAVGLLGLRARYGDRVGGLGSKSLLLGAGGVILWVIGMAFTVWMGLVGIVTVSQVEKGLWIVFFAGPAIALLGLTLFGVTASWAKPMSRWNWLPLVAGICYPVIYFFSVGYLFTHGGVFPQEYYPALQTMILLQGLALCVLGFMLVSDVRDEMAPALLESPPNKKEIQLKAFRNAGWALIGGAVAFIIGTLTLIIGGAPFWAISVILTYLLGMPLLVIGLLGMRDRYGDKIGWLGQNLLLVGAVLGPLLSLIGLAGLASPPALLGILFIAAPAVLFFCIALYGLVALYKKPLPRWNGAPFISGLWYPILTFYYIITSMSTGDWDGGPGLPLLFQAAIIILFIIQGIALAAMGYVMISDVPEEIAALA